MKWNNPLTIFIEETLAVVIGIIAFITIVIVGSVWWWYSANTKPFSADTTTMEITIANGSTLADAAEILETNKIIRNAFAFRIWAKLTGDDYTVSAGKHQLSPSMTLDQIAIELTKGKSGNEITIQFKEGLRSEEIAEIAKNKLGVSFSESLFLEKAKPLEGALFPNTYRFATDSDAENLIEKLNSEFEKVYTKLNGPVQQEQKNKVLIIASLLEREGKNANDRAVISGIIQNRLAINMALQIDATLQYALNTKRGGTWWPSPTVADKEVNSVYNTYKYPGLPPAPICNPGENALRAALNPTQNDYLYYIHDNKGNAYYATTLDQHNRNIENYLR